jgi:hypothetical protein
MGAIPPGLVGGDVLVCNAMSRERPRIEVSSTRREVTVIGNPTAETLMRAIVLAVEEYGLKAYTWRITFADRPKRVKIRDYHIPTGLPFSPPDTYEE